ncbi:uncharacterized protein VP01_2291g1 [Puccinia sorghi]|uniref:Uncharacterized protein n=1 Tax=Puccinia sorghi TaxID=27349 RepID=A0A0L6V9W2_9BASI|nr:uncharacterized protein VP01_2291g1 [Puccinia sorghi]
MPRATKRAKSLRNLRTSLRIHITPAYEARFEDSDNGSQSQASDMEELVMTLLSIKRRQYLAERVRIQHAPDISKYLSNLDTLRFKQEFRMTESFLSLLSLIDNHPIFQNNSNFPQRPVRDQLMVTLQRMGMSGNGSSIGVLARFFRISEGEVILYCLRAVEAILALERYVFILSHLSPNFSG